jgi:regulatory Fis family protein
MGPDRPVLSAERSLQHCQGRRGRPRRGRPRGQLSPGPLLSAPGLPHRAAPTSRARREDIPLLVWHFLEQLARTIGKQIERVPAATMDRLIAYDWPGNIRELRNVLKRALVLSPGPVLLLGGLGEILHAVVPVPTAGGGGRALADVEREHILRTLGACDWRIKGLGNAAAQLKLHPNTLQSRMKKLGIRRPAPGRRRAGSAWQVLPGAVRHSRCSKIYDELPLTSACDCEGPARLKWVL